MAGLITFLIAWETFKWKSRGEVIAEQLRDFGEKKHLKRFAHEDSVLLRFPVGWLLVLLLVAVSFALFVIVVDLLVGVNVPSLS